MLLALLKSPLHVGDPFQRPEKKIGDRIVLHTDCFVLGGRYVVVVMAI